MTKHKYRLYPHRKRSREEDTSDFMPISKRINNLSISNANGFGEHETIHNQNGTHATNYPMAINQYDNQSNHTINGHPNHLHSQLHTNHSTHSTNGLHGHVPSHHHHHQQQHQHHNHHNQVPKTTTDVAGAAAAAAAAGAITQDQMHLDGAAMNVNNGQLHCYSPELSVNENPHYYNKNKLLYDLHIERQRRTTIDNHRMF